MSDFVERMKDELAELEGRIVKARKYLTEHRKDYPGRGLLHCQIVFMKSYASVLKQRIDLHSK